MLLECNYDPRRINDYTNAEKEFFIPWLRGRPKEFIMATLIEGKK